MDDIPNTDLTAILEEIRGKNSREAAEILFARGLVKPAKPGHFGLEIVGTSVPVKENK